MSKEIPPCVAHAMETITEYCNEHTCDDCAFSYNYKCYLQYIYPNDWNIGHKYFIEWSGEE